MFQLDRHRIHRLNQPTNNNFLDFKVVGNKKFILDNTKEEVHFCSQEKSLKEGIQDNCVFFFIHFRRVWRRSSFQFSHKWSWEDDFKTSTPKLYTRRRWRMSSSRRAQIPSHPKIVFCFFGVFSPSSWSMIVFIREHDSRMLAMWLWMSSEIKSFSEALGKSKMM